MNGTRTQARGRPTATRTSTGPGLRKWTLAGLVAGLLPGLLAFAPARWLAQALPAGSGLEIHAPRGTVWQGSGELWLTGGPGSPDRAPLPGRLSWQLSTGPSGLGLAVAADCCTPQALRLDLGWQGGGLALRLADSTSRWPAEALRGLGTPWNTLEPQGRLDLQTQSLALHLQDGRWRMAGQALLDLNDISSALSTLQPMGSYRLALTGGTEPQLALQTLKGDLLLQGQGVWQPKGLSFRGEARAAPGRDEALAHILLLIGKREGTRTLFTLG